MGITRIFIEINFPQVKTVENLKKNVHTLYSISLKCGKSLTTTKAWHFQLLLTEVLTVCTNFKYQVFSHDIMAAILVSQSNKMTTMFVSETNPGGGGGGGGREVRTLF